MHAKQHCTLCCSPPARGPQHNSTQEWHILGINTANWRSRVLAPMTEARSGPLDSIMMTITGVRHGQAWLLRAVCMCERTCVRACV